MVSLVAAIRHTRVYQEAFEEGMAIGKAIGRAHVINKLASHGISEVEIAHWLDIDLETIRTAIATGDPDECSVAVHTS